MEKFSFEEYCFASLMVLSRAFAVNYHGEAEICMVPLVDMFNHQCDYDVSWSYRNDLGGFVTRAHKDIKRGKEIAEWYGPKPNGSLFSNYGFMLQTNDENIAYFKISLDKDDPAYELKKSMMVDKCDFRELAASANLDKEMT